MCSDVDVDDPTTGAGDGFAIDFVKLLVNVKGFSQSGTIQGTVTDAETHQPIPGARDTRGGEFLYRLSHPLGEWVIDAGKNCPAPVAWVTFDVTHYPVKLSIVTGRPAIIKAAQKLL